MWNKNYGVSQLVKRGGDSHLSKYDQVIIFGCNTSSY